MIRDHFIGDEYEHDDGLEEGEEEFSLEAMDGEEEHETIATMQEHMGYEKVECTIDSGSCVSMMPKKECRHIKIKQSAGSKRGKKYSSASGHPIENEGESEVRFLTTDEEKRRMSGRGGVC